MTSLTEHLNTPDPELHARLAFRADCPMCRRQRLMGPAPPSGLLTDHQRAGLVAGVVAVSAALPPAGAIAQGPPPKGADKGANLPPGGGVAAEEVADDLPAAPVAGERPQAPSGPPAPKIGNGRQAETPPPAPPKAQPEAEAPAPTPPQAKPHRPVPTPEPEQTAPSPPPAPFAAPESPAASPAPAPSPAPAAGGDHAGSQSRPSAPTLGATSGEAESRAGDTASSSAGDARDDRAGGGETEALAQVADSDADSDATETGGSRDAHGSTRESRSSETGVYVVQPGDSLWAIAERRLGASASDAAIAREVNRLWTANVDRIRSGDPNLIHPSEELRV
jgi:LysM domain